MSYRHIIIQPDFRGKRVEILRVLPTCASVSTGKNYEYYMVRLFDCCIVNWIHDKQHNVDP